MNEANLTGKLLRSLLAYEATRPQYQFANTDFADLMKSSEFLQNLFPNWVFVLCRYHHPQTPYFSENCQAILGYSADYLKGLAPEEYFKLIHPDDAKAVRLSYEYMGNWFRNAPQLQPKDYRFVLHYRIKSAQGGYLYLQDEQHAYENKSDKYVYFSLFKNVQGAFLQAKMEVYQRSNSDFRKVNEYTPRSEREQLITSREQEILQGIQQGLTSKQIAEKLSVSVFTVRNHRSNIFKKTGAKNMIDLLNTLESKKYA